PVVDPSSLCHYCDDELPFAPTDQLLAMGNKLFNFSWPDKLPGNPSHCSLPRITMAIDYCARHRFEFIHIPAAITGNWPFRPPFSRLFHRILSLGPILRNLCKNLDDSHFFITSRDYYGKTVTRLSSIGHQFLSSRTSEHGVGYYGERGYQMFDITLRFMFPDTFDITNFRPLTYDIALREVLIPEAAVRLIQEDLDITVIEAIAIHKESYTFGVILHPVNDNCKFYNTALSTIARSHRRTRWGLHCWEASGSTLGYEEWLQEQQELEERLAVKSEPVEGLIPKPKVLEIDGKKVDLDVSVIDLTDL
ncbi:hypothetical protein C8R45DRAFT_841964, partial [Mycena sanguinolenta]